MNLAAFRWGRRAAHDRAAVDRLVAPADNVVALPRAPRTLDDLVASRVRHLTGYQDAALAGRYVALVEKVRTAEQALGKSGLAEAVARNYAKLLAYKDEYEVARLYTQTGFLARIAEQFEGDYRVHYHLAPPLLAARNDKGQLLKRRYGPAMRHAFALLAKLKGLRGTALDVFGYTEERRTERALIGEYKALIEQQLAQLNADTHARALAIARVPEDIKGFGHVKARNLEAARLRWQALLQA